METTRVTREDYQAKVAELGIRAIGGSHVHHLMCPNYKYSSKYKLYKEIIEGRNRDELTPAAEAGIDLEPWVVKEFLKRNSNFLCHKDNRHFMSTSGPFVIAAVDRLMTNKDTGDLCVLECKTTDSMNADKWINDEMPDNYYWQCIHYMWITGAKECYLAVFIGFTQYQERYFNTNMDQVSADILRLEQAINDFWNNHILAGVAPEVDGKEETRKTIDEQANVKSFSGRLSARSIYLLDKLEDLTAQRNEIDNSINFIKNSVMQELGSFGKVETDKYKINYNQITKTDFDKGKFREEHPDLYNKYQKSSSYTMFSAKLKAQK